MPGKQRAPSHKTASGELRHKDRQRAALAAQRIDGKSNNGLERARVTDIQRARMLAAMAEVCAERGAANVTVAHVVARSGVSRRTFYEQFADREECLLAAIEEALTGVARYVVPAYETGDAWRELVRAGLVALLSFLEDQPYMGRLLIVETLGAGERALNRRQEVLSRVLEAIDQGRGEAKGGKELPALTAEGVAGGVLSVLHSRLVETGGGSRLERPSGSLNTGGSGLERPSGSLLGLAGQLMSMIVLPYLGTAAARRELRRPVPECANSRRVVPANPLHDLGMRLTYRTVRVLLSVASCPGASNRELGLAADIQDQGQASKLLTRLEKLGLIENTGAGHARGGPNAWTLTERGTHVERTIAQQTGAPRAG